MVYPDYSDIIRYLTLLCLLMIGVCCICGCAGLMIVYYGCKQRDKKESEGDILNQRL